MIGFWVANLLIPGEPNNCRINTNSGSWDLEMYAKYADSKIAILAGQCAYTYAIESNVSMEDGAAVCDAVVDEMTPLLLGASFLTGLSVTAKISLPHSDITIAKPSDYWPRERSIGAGNFCINTPQEFIENMEKFVSKWSSVVQNEKVVILIHHWLDAIGCWSFEDFYLSATTLLQIIAATEEKVTGNRKLTYFQAITSASNRVGIANLSEDFKDMRNNLVHEGKLLGGKFPGVDQNSCAVVAADVMNWFDEYIHAIMHMGPVKRIRYSKNDFISLNTYSI